MISISAPSSASVSAIPLWRSWTSTMIVTGGAFGRAIAAILAAESACRDPARLAASLSAQPCRHRRAPAAGHGTMTAVKFRELIRQLEADGWRLVAQRGSHQQYEHPTKPGKVTVAGKPNADVPKGTAANILRQAGLRKPSR
ncbi:MAG: type II toxin-antitoxin system HicA family toxin [Gaiellaceae bacterium]